MATTGADADASAPLRVRVLGEFAVEDVDLRRIRSRKARTALKVLALGRGRAVGVDRLVECLWSDGETPRDPPREVAVNLSRVRSVLGRDRVIRSDAGYRLAVDWLDLDVLDDLAAEARRRLTAGDLAAARTAAAGGLALVRGGLLEDEGDHPWLDLERAAVERTLTELRRVGAETALAVGDLAPAIDLAERALDADPFDESAARVLMRAHADAGRPGSALTTYAALRERLIEELGAGPAAATEALHLEILVENDRAENDRAEPLAVLRALARKTDNGSELPGRSAVMAQLAAARRDARHGLELVVVEGDAGLGKSRVLDAFAAEARLAGAPVLVGRCDELGLALPLQPLADALSTYLHGTDPATRARVLGDDGAVLGPLLGRGPEGAPVAGPSAPGVPGPGMTGDAMHAYVFAALVRVMARIGDAEPAVLVLDDVHLAGPATVEWLRFALRRRDEVSAVVVVTRRPEEGPTIPGTRLVQLEPLDVAAVRQIVGADRADELHRRSGGNPLLVVELAGAEGASLPSSIRESVAERIGRAGHDVAATVRATAILGPDVDLELLAAVLDRPPVLILDDLEQAVRRHLLEERGDRFAFRHALVREALVADTSAARRAFVHRQAARALEGRPDVDALALARHAQLGGERSLAARALARAADLATWRYDLSQAEHHLDDALALDPTADLHLARGKVRIARSDLAGADADGEATVRLGARPEGLALRAWAARHRHDPQAAIRLGIEGATSATDPDTRASCLLVVAMADRGLGQLPAAEQRLTEALAIETRHDLGLPGWLGVLRAHQGRAVEALDLLEPALGAEVDVVHGFWVEHVLQMAAHAHGINGEPVQALALLDRLAVELDRRGSDVRYHGLGDNYRGWILGNLGDPGALELNQEARRHGSMPEIVVQATLDLAATSYRKGRLDEAADLVAAAAEQAASAWFTNRWRCDQRVAFLGALVALADHRGSGALDQAHVLASAAGSRGDARYATFARLLIARARHQLGEPVALDEVASILTELPAVSGLEAWWLTAETAAAFRVDGWWALADQRVATLAAHAGDRRDPFVAHAAARLAAVGRP